MRRRTSLSIRFDRHIAVLSLPAFGLILGAYLALGRRPALVIVAALAYSVAFGVARQIGSQRWAAMAATGGGITFVAFVGTIAGRDPDAELVGAAVWRRAREASHATSATGPGHDHSS